MANACITIAGAIETIPHNRPAPRNAEVQQRLEMFDGWRLTRRFFNRAANLGGFRASIRAPFDTQDLMRSRQAMGLSGSVIEGRALAAG